MTVKSQTELTGLLRAGRLVALTIQEMKHAIKPGMTTAQLDSTGERILRLHGAKSAPKVTYNFPGTNCISINDEAAHGIPGSRVIREGDLVKIDVSLELNGYFADANITVAVPPVTPLMQKLMDCAKDAFEKGVRAALTGKPINAIGRAIEKEVKRQGFSVLQELPGHGIGRKLHENPTMPNFYVPRYNRKLHTGLVFTIEPHISADHTHLTESEDGWTLKTANGSLSASYEHTVIVMPDEAIIVTQ